MKEEEARGKKQTRNGHTFRRNINVPTNPSTVLIRQNPRVQPDTNGVMEFPITEIDQYFDDGFSFSPYTAERALNTEVKWSQVEEALKSPHISSTTHHDKYYNGRTHIFRVPVSGHLIVQNNRRDVQEKLWLRWKGKLHDPNLIYKLDGVKLRPLCPQRSAQDPEPGLEDRIEGAQLIARDEVFISRNDLQRGSKQQCKSKSIKLWNGRPYAEMNFKGSLLLEQLAIVGGYPHRLQQFPPAYRDRRNAYLFDVDTLQELRELEEQKPHGRRPFVMVAADEDLSWVESFDIYFRDLLTGRWRLYKEAMEGNHDAITPKVHRVRIFAQALRIAPRHWHGDLAMRIRIYGATSGIQKTSRGNEVNLHRTPASPEQEEVVTYELQPPRPTHWRHDGVRSYRYWRGGEESKWFRKNQISRAIREEAECCGGCGGGDRDDW